MACQSCTRDEQCVACRMEGRPAPRLPRYEGRRGETLTSRGKFSGPPPGEDPVEGPDWHDLEDDTPPARRTATRAGDHAFTVRR